MSLSSEGRLMVSGEQQTDGPVQGEKSGRWERLIKEKKNTPLFHEEDRNTEAYQEFRSFATENPGFPLSGDDHGIP